MINLALGYQPSLGRFSYILPGDPLTTLNLKLSARWLSPGFYIVSGRRSASQDKDKDVKIIEM
jgi:hypothetical protein